LGNAEPLPSQHRAHWESPRGMYANLQYSGNTGTITIAASVYVAAGSSDPTGTTVNAYGIYVKRPIAGDTNTALYADDITSNNDITIATGSLAINTTVLAAGYFPYQATNKLARSALFQAQALLSQLAEQI